MKILIAIAPEKFRDEEWQCRLLHSRNLVLHLT